MLYAMFDEWIFSVYLFQLIVVFALKILLRIFSGITWQGFSPEAIDYGILRQRIILKKSQRTDISE